MSKFADIFAPLRARKTSLAALDRDIAKLEVDIGALKVAPPDREGVLQWALRAVDRAEADFAEHLRGWWLAERNVAGVPGKWFDENPGPLWLEAQTRCPGMIHESHESRARMKVEFDRKALMALLAPVLRQSIPRWIDEHFPIQKGALASAERERRLTDLESRLAELHLQRNELAEELSQARSEIGEIVQ